MVYETIGQRFESSWARQVPVNPPTSEVDGAYMREALMEARRAEHDGEVPVGAVVVVSGGIVGRGFDRREVTHDPTAHAEVLALREAAARLGTWRLSGATLYVTLEPCVMCVGALLHARVAAVVYGAVSPKWGAIESVVELGAHPGLNHRLGVRSGVERDACAALLATFFSNLRRKPYPSPRG